MDTISRFRKIINSPVYTYSMLVLMGIGTGLLSLLLASSVFGVPMFKGYLYSPLLVLLNIAPTLLIILLAYFISGRAWIAFLSAAVITLVPSTINYFKIQLRGDPFIAADLSLTAEAGKIMQGYTLPIGPRNYIAIAFVLIGVLICVFLVRRRQTGIRLRAIAAAAIIIISAVLFMTAYKSRDIYDNTKPNYDVHNWSDSQKFISRGFMYPFILSIHDTVKTPPDGFSEKSAAELLSQFGYDDIPDGKKASIISIMLESYTDLSAFTELEYTTDVYELFDALRAESVSGTLVNNVFGGGTIDTERLFLTGDTVMGDYKSASASYVRYLSGQGYYTEGLHAGDAWFYDRQSINLNIGFDNYYFMEDFEFGSRQDSFFFPQVLELYEMRDKSVPYFSYNLSYQNHGAYESGYLTGGEYIQKGAMSDESYNILNNYLDGIYDTNQLMSDFVDSFRELSEPVVLVIFGDHMPWLGNGDSVYHELGVSIDVTTPEGIYNYYSTPYLIWANDSAKELLGSDFVGDGGSFSPCFLMNRLFDLMSYGGDEYMKAANKLFSYTDILHSRTGYFRQNGVLTLELYGEAAEYYKSFKLMEYYRKQNFSD